MEERRQRGGCDCQREQGRLCPPAIVCLCPVIRLKPEQQQRDSGDEDAEAERDKRKIDSRQPYRWKGYDRLMPSATNEPYG